MSKKNKIQLSSVRQEPRSAFVESVVANPVLIDPQRVSEFAGCLHELANHERFEDLSARQEHLSNDDYWPDEGSWECRYKPYNVVNGVLQIPVMGALINRMGYQIGRYATGYTYIERAFERGMADPAVKGIAFIIDSPGGEAAGNFELTDKLYEARGTKPMRSFVADHAYSGGFSIATASPQIIVTRSGGTGSVGVVTMHVDMSEMLKDWGLKITYIFAGKHKVDGNPYEALSNVARERIQGRIDKIYGVFTSTVARNRSMTDDDVRKTEALTYDADQSIEVGFADRIGAFDEEVTAFELEVAQPNGEGPMTSKTNEDATITQADVDSAVETAKTEATTEATAAERKRFGDVMGHAAYAGREAQAHKMLTSTDLSAEQITGILETSEAKAPETGAGAGTSHFSEHMDREGGPDVGADAGPDDDADANTPEANAARILAADAKSRGVTITTKATK